MGGSHYGNAVGPRWGIHLYSGRAGPEDGYVTPGHDSLGHADSCRVLAGRQEANPHARIGLADDTHAYRCDGAVHPSLHEGTHAAHYLRNGHGQDISDTH